MVASSTSVQRAAADAVVAITGKICPSMLEFMDDAQINAVEDKLKMGLDRKPRPCWWPPTTAAWRASRTPSSAARVFTEAGATEVFSD